MKYLRLLIGCILLVIGSNLYAQLDTEFWFAVPYAYTGHDANNQYRFVFSTSDQPSRVIISQPANPSFTPIIRDMDANATLIVNLSEILGRAEALRVVNVANQENVVSNYGFKIMASHPVFCYYEIHTPTSALNTELFSLKGRNALGTDFLIPMQNILTNDYTTSRACFLVLATENETMVKITPTQNLVGHPTGLTFTITLNAGQFYVARASNTSAGEHPTGSVVTSNKQVTITYADDSMRGTPWGGCADIGGDQIIPTNMLGTEYIAVQGFLQTHTDMSGNTPPYDDVFALATVDGTRIKINGGTTQTLNRGQTYRYRFTTNPETSGSAVLIQSDQPIYVYQLSGFGCETGYSILPAMDCRGSSSVSVVRSTTMDFYLTLLAAAKDIENFTFNGSRNVIVASDFKDVPSTNGNWKFARKKLTLQQLPERGIAKVENSSGVFHLGVIHGMRQETCRFGYFSDFSAYQFEIESVYGDTLCEGETLELRMNDIAGSEYLWKLPDGSTATGSVIHISNLEPSHSGNYTISGKVNNCAILPDVAHVLVKPMPTADFRIERTECFPQPINFSNTSTIQGDVPIDYSWDFGDGSPASTETNPSHVFPASGVYTVRLTASFQGCVNSIQHEITVPEPLTLYYTDTICTGSPYEKNGFNIPAEDIDYAGVFEFIINDTTFSGCDSIRMLTLTVEDSKVSIQILVEPFCMDHYTILSAITELPYILWNTGETLPIVRIEKEGVYMVTASGYNCSASDSLVIESCCPPDDFNVPNIITPSSKDGLNDYFTIPDSFTPTTSEIYIYNRWGRVVFESKEPVFKWDGTVNNKIVQGVYYYVLTINNDCIYHGVITVR